MSHAGFFVLVSSQARGQQHMTTTTIPLGITISKETFPTSAVATARCIMVRYLYLGPVLVCAVFVPQFTCGGPLVAHEGIRYGCSLHRVTGGQVHDDAHLKGMGQRSKHEGDEGHCARDDPLQLLTAQSHWWAGT